MRQHSHHDDLAVLIAIGLTKTQARCYLLLSGRHLLPAGKIAEELKVSRTNLYELLEDLRRKGFVTEINILVPAKYRAVPLVAAMPAYAEYQNRQVRELIIRQQLLQ